MRIEWLAALTIAAATLVAAPADAQGQSRTSGCGSPIIINSRNVTVNASCGQDGAQLRQLTAKLNALSARGVLSPQDLSTFATNVNSRFNKVSADTDAIRILLAELLQRLEIAEAHPERARLVLRPYLQPDAELSNQSVTIDRFLDVNGEAEARLVFQIHGRCQLFITPPRGTGFLVGLAVESDRGSRIWSSLMGTQGAYRPIPLSDGVYVFRMRAVRGAGQYAATVATRCQED